MHRTRYCTQGCGIWIRFHFLRLRIQLFITMRIRIQLYSQSRSRSTALRNSTGGLHVLAYIEPVQWYRVLHKHLFLLRYGNTLEQLHPNGTYLEVIQVHTATIIFVFIPVRVLLWILVNITIIITFVVVIPLTVSSDEDCERSTARRRRTNGWCEVNEGIGGALADTPATIKLS